MGAATSLDGEDQEREFPAPRISPLGPEARQEKFPQILDQLPSDRRLLREVFLQA